VLNIPVLRWGEPYTSLETSEIVHFDTGEPVAKMSQANGAMLQRDLRKAKRAREALRKIPIRELIGMMKTAADYYLNAELPMGDGTQTPDQFVRQQSASTGLPEVMCRANMKKNHFVLTEMENILNALTRGLDLDVLTRGYGEERGVPISYQAQSSVLGLVLPSNSPGVHALWMPIIPMQIGLVLKPGSSEPWTPYRITEAFYKAGVPRESIALYPGPTDVGASLLNHCDRSLIFGGAQTVDLYKGNPRVQAHGPGFSKILIGDDHIDQWEKYLDVLFDSVYLNGGRSCINCSAIWVSRHGRDIADALAKRLAEIKPLASTDPNAGLAAFTTAGVADSINASIDVDVKTPGVTDFTAKHRDGGRLVKRERHDYLLPTVLFCESPEPAVAYKEFMFPFVSVVECPESKMIERIGPTLVCTAITDKPELRRDLLDATHVDRLNFGPIPTTRLNWLQPHEGNIVEFLYRARAFQAQ